MKRSLSQPRPALASRQICSGWPAISALGFDIGTIEWPEFLKIFQVLDQMDRGISRKEDSKKDSAAELAPAA